MARITKEMLEKLLPDWSVSIDVDGYSFELETHSPSGEDVLLTIQGYTFEEMEKSVEEYYDDFDPEDHAAVIYHAKHYGTPEEQRFYASAPEGLEELLVDARWIDNAYWQVREVLRKEYENGADDGDDE